MVWLGVQAEGSLRHVLWRPVDRAAWDASESEDAALAWAAADDLAHQRHLLQAGFIGVRMRDGDAAVGFKLAPS